MAPINQVGSETELFRLLHTFLLVSMNLPRGSHIVWSYIQSKVDYVNMNVRFTL